MVFEKVREILCDQLDLEQDEVTMTSNIVENLGADSLDMVDLAMTLEDEFLQEVSDETLKSFETVSD
ncbi:MAG: acyl carrier protein, partial [Clostridia bacterium]|nr:acyl carrier protein [Clostridia bacterium]